MRHTSLTARAVLLAAFALFGIERASAAPAVPDGPEARSIRRTLAAIALPPGFAIELYALVPGARSIAVGPKTGAVFVGTRGNQVFVVTDAVRPFAPGAAFNDPNGVCFAPDGTLFVAEQNRVTAFPDAETGGGAPREVVPQGKLIPAAEQSSNHAARVCRVGPDGKLYVAVGQPHNVPPRAKLALYREWGMGGIVRFDRDGGGREVFARGIRNSVGLDFDPRSNELWFTDNQVDGMGDTIPPGEINHATAPGQDFGFPWYGGGHVRTVPYASDTPPAGLVFPAVEETAHAADLGMTFYRGTAFPARYRHAIFSAQHGSWNRSTPVGARVMVTFVQPDGSAGRSEPFASGWLNAAGRYDGRPVDVAELPDGSLLVSDDDAGALYRISVRPRP